MLPEGVGSCPFCGFPVNAGAQIPTGDASTLNKASTGVYFGQAGANSVSQAGAGTAQTGFVYQEFGANPGRSATAPGFAPQSMPGYQGIAPGFAPQSMPRYQGIAPGFAPQNMPGYPGTVPSAFPQGSGQGMYPPPMMPVAAPVKPKRRGRSVGCIVLYVLLAIALLFTGLGVALYAVVSHASTNYVTTKTAAMQLYQQVTSQPATIADLLAGPTAFNNWSLNRQMHSSCELDNAALRISTDAKGIFNYCANINNFSSDIALQAQMQIAFGDGGGLVFRVTRSADGSTAGFYFFNVNLQGRYAIYMHQIKATQQVSLLATGITQAMFAQPGRTNIITVIAKGTLFDLYLNQQFVVQFQNSALNGAMIGVAASDETHPTSVLYTGIKLWDLDK